MELFAYKFESDLELPQMLTRAREVTAWRLFHRESDRLGEYLSGAARGGKEDLDPPCDSTVRLLDLDRHRYALNILYRSRLPDASEDFASLHGEIRERLLPALHARNVQRVEDYE